MSAGRRGVTVACAALVLVAGGSSNAAAQRTAVWFDASGSRTIPPASAGAESATYGLIGLRALHNGRGSGFEAGILGGRGIEKGGGSWVSGRLSYDVVRVIGRLDVGVRADGTGMTYLQPVAVGDDADYTSRSFTGSVSPRAGVSLLGFRAAVEGTFAGGGWSTKVETAGPDRPLPIPGAPTTGTTSQNGDVRVTGGGVSVSRMIGPVSVNVAGARYDARNMSAPGRYAGVDATIGMTAGPADLVLGVRRWNTPLEEDETGAHAALGFAIGRNAYVRSAVTRSVTDPYTGTRGNTGFTAGISLRVGGTAERTPAATAGARAPGGRSVAFTFDGGSHRTVAVAGDFSAWEPRTMRRADDGTWVFETILPPGVYHYSFIVDGETWTLPDNAAGIVDDGFGRKNATVVVPELNGQTP